MQADIGTGFLVLSRSGVLVLEQQMRSSGDIQPDEQTGKYDKPSEVSQPDKSKRCRQIESPATFAGTLLRCDDGAAFMHLTLPLIIDFKQRLAR